MGALRRQLGGEWPVRVVIDPDVSGGPHLIVVGRFSTRADAREARSTVEEQLSRSLEVRRLPAASRR
jgi:hypothetical protein